MPASRAPLPPGRSAALVQARTAAHPVRAAASARRLRTPTGAPSVPPPQPLPMSPRRSAAHPDGRLRSPARGRGSGSELARRTGEDRKRAHRTGSSPASRPVRSSRSPARATELVGQASSAAQPPSHRNEPELGGPVGRALRGSARAGTADRAPRRHRPRREPSSLVEAVAAMRGAADAHPNAKDGSASHQ